jgi:hypothetical protein
MDNKELKEKTLALMNDMRKELDELVSVLDDRSKNEIGSMEQWSARDMLAHLAFWGRHFNEQLEKAMAGEPVPMAGDYYEILNDGVLMRNLNRSFDEVHREEEDAFNKTINLLTSMDADDLAEAGKYEYLNDRSLIDRALGTEGWHVLSHLSEYYAKRGGLMKAEVLQTSYTDELKEFPGWKANAFYNLACFYSLNGIKEKAYENLEIAFKERPELKEWAQKDPDMQPICEEAEFKALMK